MNQNFLIVLMLGICLMSCSEKRTSSSSNPLDLDTENYHLDIPESFVNKSALFYDTKKSLWTLNEELYSGYAVSFYQDSTLKEKFGILKGRKQNEAIDYYADGKYKLVSNYHYGKLNGDKKSWSYDSLHTLISHLQYVSGKPHGEQKKWYPSGVLFKKLNLNMGKEEGLQQAFRENGTLFANYEAKEGRIFGLNKAALCYGLEDESIQYSKR